MKTITEFICATFSVAILTIGAVTANSGPLTKPRPRPTPAPRPTPPLTADIGSSYSNSKVPYTLDYPAILTAIGHCCSTNIWEGYADLNGDGIPDVVFTFLSGSTEGSPIIIALGQPGGSYVDGTTQVISGEVPLLFTRVRSLSPISMETAG